jgi:NitT/TauT family transport system substrate-binding protein
MKKKLSLLLCAVLAISCLAGCGSKSNDTSSADLSDISQAAEGAATPTNPDQTKVNFTVLSGPTGVGAAWLIDHYSADAAPASSDFGLVTTIANTNDEVTAALINGDTDIAAISTNLAATLSAKTDGNVQVLAVNTLGVLYILEKGDSVQSISDLRGKTLYAPSNTKGANPEYILNYLLEQNDVQPDQVDIQWLTPQEITTKMTTEDSGICMLPVPAATALMLQDSSIRQAISLSDAWAKLDKGALPMGCVVARTDFVEQNPEVIQQFLNAYQSSIAFMVEPSNLDEAALLATQYEITASTAIAAAAIPQCNLVFVTGEEMKDMLEQYYQVLFQANPASIGGSMPYDSFYYGVS